jgi:hypothetical protein
MYRWRRYFWYQDIQDADMLVQLLMDCTSQEINYGIRIKQKQYMEMESLSRIFCYDMNVSRLRQMADSCIFWRCLSRVLFRLEQTNKKWYMFSSPVSQSVQMEEIFLLYLDFIFCSIYDCVTSLLMRTYIISCWSVLVWKVHGKGTSRKYKNIWIV